MFWLLIICIASSIGALLALDRSWRRKFEDAQLATRTELASLHAAQDQAGLQVRAQQEVIFNSMVEGLLLLNDTGRIQLANRAFGDLFGATADLRSRTIIEALRLHELAELVDSLSAEKQVLDYEFKLSRPNERWLEVNGAAFFDSRGRRSGTILVFHDLTRLKQLESARQEFVANVSHELRTPLSLIKGYVETLLDGARQNPGWPSAS